MATRYDNYAPTELIKNLTSTTPGGANFWNQPSANEVIERIAGPGAGLLRTVPELLQRNEATQRAKKGYQEEEGSFVAISQRTPFVLTCQRWLDLETPRFIFCRVNPESVDWSYRLRVSNQETLSGTVQHGWRQRRGRGRPTFFTEPVISINFQSGNLMPVVPDPFYGKKYQDAKQAIQIPQGLDSFYAFAELLDDSRVYDVDDNQRFANVVYILYNSMIYPSMVLVGMFDPDGFRFSDGARDPLGMNWTASFTIYDSTPRFSSYNDLRSAWFADKR